MFKVVTQRKIGSLISITSAAITLFITPALTLDPINVSKLWLLSALAFGVLGLLLLDIKPLFDKNNWTPIIAAKMLLFFMVASFFINDASFSQQFFGTYGRNTGLLTYFAFVFLFIGASIATSKSIKKPLLTGFSIALGVNAVYGLIQTLGGDPFNWSNPYDPVIGTLGNPNFVSAFLGMGIALAFTYIVAPGVQIKFKVLAGLYIAIALYDILKSDAQQGIIVSFLSIGLVGYFVIGTKFKNSVYKYSYLAAGVLAFLFGLFGTLQKGPFSSLIYKASVTYRGDYWHAGLQMVKSHMILGVGLDSYGDWYRASRTVEATLRRGPSTVSNAAHNVYIDIAATAGIFALIAYIAVIALGLRAAHRISKRANGFDPFFVGIFVAWVGYLIQSAISINNIALGIWGWVLPGVLISMDKWHLESKSEKKAKTTDFSGMGLVAGMIVGAVIGYFPFNSDASFRHAIETGNANNIYNAALKWPTDSSRINYATQIFDQNKMKDKAVTLARESVKLNPRSFDAWMYLYNSSSVSGNEKREILDTLKMLDPHNLDLAELG